MTEPTPTPGAMRAADRIRRSHTYLSNAEVRAFANIIDEETAAGELLEALRFMVDAADTEPGMLIYRAHIEQARKAIARATK